MPDRLFRDHAADLHRFLSRRLADPRDADDLLQEIFLRAVRTPPATGGPAWLYTVARNVLTDHYRRARREAPVEAVPDTAIITDVPRAERDRAARCAAGLLDQLPAEQATALRLVDLAGTRQQDAARTAGLSLSGLKSRVQRGRAALATLLAECCRIHRDARGTVTGLAPCTRACGC
ncbi:sigma-70 family RNA polymerase sigma factor [Actinocorallia lasiicapitis]